MADWITCNKPFVDTETVIHRVSASNYDTIRIDDYRQGTEAILPEYIFNKLQRKIRTGTISIGGTVSQSLDQDDLGNAPDFAEFFNSPIFLDNQLFRTEEYVEEGNNYPLPLLFNDGPQINEESFVEIRPIPFRKLPSNEGPFYAYRVYGGLCEGNDLDNLLTMGSSQFDQFIEVKDPIIQRPYYEEGEDFWGYLSGSTYIRSGITIPGYTNNTERVSQLFTEKDKTIYYIDTVTGPITESLSLLDYGIGVRIQQEEKKSMSAGRDCYISKYGTDSMVYIGLRRGS